MKHFQDRFRFLSAFLLAASAQMLSADEVDFARDIRPILSENCFFCHGPDEQKREADLRLDTQEGAYSVMQPGDANASDLIARIIADDADIKMPPPDSNRSLTPSQIAVLKQWIDEGASWNQHWSFRPIVRPEVPLVTAFENTPRINPIDHFVQAKLASESKRENNLRPSPEADRRTLIRRLTLDLTGLPPTPTEVTDFVEDHSSDAYIKIVRRLLESPAYGQRMAWDWLDAARYADTNGYQGDNERTMWPWRDWVVRAFNENVPFDEFTRWQLAGDLIPDATEDQILATGFCRNHAINGEGGRIPEENRVEYVMDMAETTGTVWMALTMNCCRCHDHKYDPLTNEDYYSLFAFFNQTPVKGNGGDAQTAPVLAVASPEQSLMLAQIGDELTSVDAAISQVVKDHRHGQPEWEALVQEKAKNATRWQTLEPDSVFGDRANFRLLDDHSALSIGDVADIDTYRFNAKLNVNTVTGIRLETLPHSSMSKGGLSRSSSGNFVLTDIEVSYSVDGKDLIPLAIESAEATYSQPNHEIAKAIDDDAQSGWAVFEDGRVRGPHSAVFRFGTPTDLPDEAKLHVVLKHESSHAEHNIGRFRISVASEPHPHLPDDASELIAILDVPSASRTKAQADSLAQFYRESIPAYQKLQQQRAAIVQRRDALQAKVPKIMVMADMDEPRATYVLERGLYSKPAQEVKANLPGFLVSRPAPINPNIDATQPRLNRLALADWLVSDDNPLTARVIVNRVWQQFFGIGLVKTAEDFGVQGEIPIHRDLLNWLAADLRENGWNMKRLIEIIVTSHTYRQSSNITDAKQFELDPANRLLSRGSRFRMPAWMIRDQALAVSGLLCTTVGGPSVSTYQPAGVWEEASFGKKTYAQGTGEELYRRSLYIFWRRIAAPTMLFDNATRQTCSVKSGRTNTPLHALLTLNDVTYVEAARVLAQTVLSDDSSDDAARRLEQVVQRALARQPSEQEAAIFLAGLERTQQQFAAVPQEAQKLLAIGESGRDEDIDPILHASWTTLCLAVLNLDETLNHE